MAMTLRLSAQQDAALTLLAESMGVSKHEAATRAIVEKAARMLTHADIAQLAREEIESYRATEARLRRHQPSQGDS